MGASAVKQNDAYNRGFEDADKGRPALFFEKRGEFWTHSDDPGADDWDQQARSDYLRGYEDSEAADGIR